MKYSHVKLNKELRTVEPHVYVVTLITGAGTPSTEVYQYTTVRYSEKEAVEEALKNLRENNAVLYQGGEKLGGWRRAGTIAISAWTLEKMFRDAGENEKKHKKTRGDERRNSLMKEILERKDPQLLHDNVEELGESAVRFLHNELIKPENYGKKP